jgi:hypothetical protein
LAIAVAIEPVATSAEKPGSSLRLVLALLGLVGCAAAQYWIRHGLYWTPATLLLIGAAVVVALQFPPISWPLPATEPIATPSRASRLVALAGFLIAAATSVALSGWWHETFDLAAPLLLVGMSVWSLGLARGDRHRAGCVPPQPMSRNEWLLFAGVIALDLFFRFWRYWEFPPASGFCSVEEAFTGRTADYILSNGARPWEFIGDVWLAVPFFHFFGQSTTTLRIGFTIVSALTVPALYFLLRDLVGVRAALVTGALFAVARWHVIYGRHAHNIFATTLVLVLVLYLCVRIHRRGGLAAYPWLGFLTGYTLYTYAGFRSTPVYVGLFLVLSLAAHWWSERGRPQWSAALRMRFAGLGLAALGMLMVLLPLAGRVRENPMFLFEAAFRSTVVNPNFREGSTADLLRGKLQQGDSALKLFNHYGDNSEVFNLSGTPMLDPVSGVLLVIGAACCVIRPLRAFQGYFLLIALTQLMLGAVAVGHLDVRRLASIIPFLFILMGFAVAGLLGLLEQRGKVLRAVFGAVVVAALAAAICDNYRVYFGGMMHSDRTRWAFQTDYSSSVRYVRSLPPNSYMLLVSNMLNFFQDNDYAWARGNDVPGAVTSDLEPVLTASPGPWSGRDLFVLIYDPYEHAQIVEMLTRAVPATQCGPFTDRDTPPWHHFTSCKLPAGYQAVPVTPTLKARYYYGDAAEAFLEQDQRALSYALFPDRCRLPLGEGKPPCRAEYSGVWHVAENGLYELAVEIQGGTVELTLDGTPITKQPMEITAGAHEIRGRARFETQFEAGARLKVRKAGTDKWSLVRFEAPRT